MFDVSLVLCNEEQVNWDLQELNLFGMIPILLVHSNNVFINLVKIKIVKKVNGNFDGLWDLGMSKVKDVIQKRNKDRIFVR